MATITITDTTSLTATLQIGEGSFLAKAGLHKLAAQAKDFVTELDKPVDQALIKDVQLGPAFTSPQLLTSGVWTLSLNANVLSELTIVSAKSETLFGTGPFCPVIPVTANQAWVGFKVAATVGLKAGASVNAFGLAIKANAAIACTTYSLSQADGTPLPSLHDACATCLSHFSVATGHDDIRKQNPGTVNQTEASGSITLKATVKVPCSLNALASADVPFKTTVSVQPDVTAEVTGTVKVTGDFIFRSHKVSEREVQIGMYKKKGISLSASFTAGAGLEGDVGSSDVLGTILSGALPGIDLGKVGLHDANSQELNAQAAALSAAIKDNIDGTLTAQVNANFVSSVTDQAAVVYTILLDQGDTAATDKALDEALQGRWAALDGLVNVTRDGAITVHTVEKKGTLTLNLFGLYSATSVADFMKTCTVLIDPTGQVSLINSTDTSRIRGSVAPYASDTNKLRKALLQDFVCTATYAAVAGALQVQLAARQFYLDYQQTMKRQEMKRNVLIGYALDAVPHGAMDDAVSANAFFSHAWVDAAVSYDRKALLAIFFSDLLIMQPRTQNEFEAAGRNALASLLDPADPDDAVRLKVFANGAWEQMNAIGDTAGFAAIPQLRGLTAPQLSQVANNWVCIRWWAPVMAKVAPVLNDTLQAVKNSTATDPTKDQDVMRQQKQLTKVLGDVTRASSPDMIGTAGWGEAVMCLLSKQGGRAAMEFVWDKNHRAFP